MVNTESYGIDRPSKLPEKNWLVNPKYSYQKYVHGFKRRKPYGADIDDYHEHTVRVCVVDTIDLLPHKFKRLLGEWQEQAAHLSSINAKVMVPAYLEIIGMGQPALALILNELKEKPTYLFPALRAITGFDPVPPEDRGRIRRMANAWIEWGRQRKIIE